MKATRIMNLIRAVFFALMNSNSSVKDIYFSFRHILSAVTTVLSVKDKGA